MLLLSISFCIYFCFYCFFFFQAEDGIRDRSPSRGLGDVYKRQFSTFVVDGMSNKEISALKAKIEDVDHVKTVLWYDSVADISIPTDMLPEKMQKVFLSDEGTLMFIMYDTTMSADETMEAVEQIRAISNEQCFLSGMSAVVTDIRDLSDKEVPVYVLLAVILSLVVLSLTMDSFLIPIFFLLSIGMAIIYNLGTNVFMGEISYVTKALSAVLQLGVTMDYSIFLWHSYENQKKIFAEDHNCLLYTSPSPRDGLLSRMPSSA